MALNTRTRSAAAGSLLDALCRLGSTIVSIFHTRVELLLREFERERLHVTRLILLGIGVLFFLALGAITLTIFIIVVFWDSQRLVVIGFLAALYLGIAGGLALWARREAARSSSPFSASVAQLKKDREYFKSQS